MSSWAFESLLILRLADLLALNPLMHASLIKQNFKILSSCGGAGRPPSRRRNTLSRQTSSPAASPTKQYHYPIFLIFERMYWFVNFTTIMRKSLPYCPRKMKGNGREMAASSEMENDKTCPRSIFFEN
jgi:hypothetical protein